MFEITRIYPEPSDLLKKQYNTSQIINALSDICHSKCYLCENDKIQEVEVEHFYPHTKDPSQKYVWDNLFYSCKRCNRIKSDTHFNLLNPCEPTHKIFRNIHLIPPARIADAVSVNNLCPNNDPLYEKSQNTVALLNLCFNDKSTPARRISRVDLINYILNELSNIYIIRAKLSIKRLTKLEENEEKERLLKMANPNYPFSAFWRWYILDDPFLFDQVKDVINF